MNYYLVLFPGPLKLRVTRAQYEVAAADAAPIIDVPQKGSFIMMDKYVFSIEDEQIACVVGRAEQRNFTGQSGQVFK